MSHASDPSQLPANTPQSSEDSRFHEKTMLKSPSQPSPRLLATNEGPQKRKAESNGRAHRTKRVKLDQHALAETYLDGRAAKVCLVWLSEYKKLPDDKTINGLAATTDSPVDNVRSWFGTALVNGALPANDSGLGCSHTSSSLSVLDGEELPTTSSVRRSKEFELAKTRHRESQRVLLIHSSEPEMIGADYVEASQQHIPLSQSISQISSQTVHENDNNTTFSELDASQKAALALAAKKGRRLVHEPRKCKPVENAALLIWDPEKPFQCTRKCGQNFQKKDDWRKHEEIKFPQEGWVCTLKTVVTANGVRRCAYCEQINPAHDHASTHHRKHWAACQAQAHNCCEKSFYRKQHFKQHFKSVHPHLQASDYEPSSYFPIESDFSRHCGFCTARFGTWKDRLNHIAEHFETGRKHMRDWRDPLPPDGVNEKGPKYQDEPDSDSDSDENDDDNDRYHPMPRCQTSSKSETRNLYGSENSTGSARFAEGRWNTSLREEMDLQSRLAMPFSSDKCSKRFWLVTNPEFSQKKPSNFRPVTAEEDSSKIPCRTTFEHSNLEQVWRSQINRLPKSIPSLFGVRYLGRGGSSIVDEVFHPSTNNRYARKTLFNPAIGFAQEVEILHRVQHRHIVQLVGAVEEPLSKCLLLNPVAETNLQDYLEGSPPTRTDSHREITEKLGCLASAILFLHSSKKPNSRIISHNDIKPANILVTQAGHLLLSDFGSARFVNGGHDSTISNLARTATYSAPETILRWDASTKADIFSLGCVFLEVLSWLILGTQALRAFKAQKFEYDGSYSRNLPQAYAWLASLYDSSIGQNKHQIRAQIKMIHLMMETDPLRRPSASDICQVFTPARCCCPQLPPKSGACYANNLPQYHNQTVSLSMDEGVDVIYGRREPSSRRNSK